MNTCGCTWDGPIQVLTCGDHNVAAKNLNRAQVLFLKMEMERDRYKDALEKILNIRVQDKQIVDAWKEARQIAFDAFSKDEPSEPSK